MDLFIPDLLLKIIGGFTDYHTSDSTVLLGRPFKWGAFDQTVDGTYHVLASRGFCTFDHGWGYCYQRLIISSNTSYTGPGYDIRGGYIQFVDDGNIAMNWGVNYTSPGFRDTVVFRGEAITSTGVRDANLHLVLETIDGPFQFREISEQMCNINTNGSVTESKCKDEVFISTLRERASASIAHEFPHFRCWSTEWGSATSCKSYIWI